MGVAGVFLELCSKAIRIASQAEKIIIFMSCIKMSEFSHLASKTRAPVEMQLWTSSRFLIFSCTYEVMATPSLVSQTRVIPAI